MKNILFVNLFFAFCITNAQDRNYNDKRVLRVPIVFHIIHESATESIIPDSVFYNLINEVNKSFNNVDVSKIDPLYKSNVARCDIEFYIPSKDRKGKIIDGISWHKTTVNRFDFGDDKPFTSIGNSYLDSNKNINIYFVSLKKGYGYVSTNYKLFGLKRYDGAVIELLSLFKKSIDFNDVQNKPPKMNLAIFSLTHELGHVLGLKHIWGGLLGEANSCIGSDGILDTPSQKKENNVFDSLSYDRRNRKWKKLVSTCRDRSKLSNYQNYMDYGYGLPNGQGMFTHDQREVMRNNLINKRKGLFQLKTQFQKGSFIDIRDNKKYSWVQVGTQKWMSENLNYKSSKSKCFNNKEQNCNVYGRLYTWNEAINVCPNGWHLPSHDEWEVLRKQLGKDQSQVRSKTRWLRNKNGTNTSGLNFLPSGYGQMYFKDYKYYHLGTTSMIWLSGSSVFGHSRTIGGYYGFRQLPWSGATNKSELLSCRCVAD